MVALNADLSTAPLLILTLIQVDLTHFTYFWNPYPHSTETIANGIFVSCHFYQDGEVTLQLELKEHLVP